jgi:hypothetical protein
LRPFHILSRSWNMWGSGIVATIAGKVCP